MSAHLFGPSLCFKRAGFRTVGWTFYSPYTSMYIEEPRLVAQPLMTIVSVGNLFVLLGCRRLQAGRKSAILWLGLALFLPLFLEALPHFLTRATSEPPRRYHYYSFAPKPPTLVDWLGQPGWIGHAIGLVFLMFGLIVDSTLNREPAVESLGQ